MKKILIGVAIAASTTGLAGAQTVEAPPPLIPFSGAMTASSGGPFVGIVSAIFSLYDEPEGGVPLWVDIQMVQTDATGWYLALLGAATELPVDLFATSEALWLGVQPEGQAEQPRVRFLSVPYALKARDADTLGGRPLADFVLLSGEYGDGEGSGGAKAAGSLTTEDSDGPGTASDTINTNLTVVGNILFGPNLRGTLGEVSGDLVLDLNPGANFLAIRNSSDNEIAHFANSGRVGIGTAAPQAKLDVTGNIFFGANSRGVLGEASGDLVLDLNAGANFFAIRNAFDTELAHFASTGLVGIGTATPQAKLDVIGDIIFGANSRGFLGEASGDLVLDMNTGAGFFAIRDSSNNQLLHVASNGNVGIGTSTPSVTLDVAGSLHASGTITGGSVAAMYQDVAEWVDAREPLAAGTVVTVDPAASNRVRASEKEYDTAVLGAISLQPGLILGESGPKRVMVAQSGRVMVNVDASYGAIGAGDLLSTSPTPGHAMRSEPLSLGDLLLHGPGTVLGKALEPLRSGRGQILVLVTLQ